MSYDEYVDDLSDRVKMLAPRSSASIFWLAGSGLTAGLSESESAGWSDWLDQAREISVDFIVSGRVDNRLPTVWGRASSPTGPDATQLLNSSIICLSSALAIAVDPDRPGSWIEHALFPVVQVVSLDLFDDVAFPGDDELDDVIADHRFLAAYDYLVSACARLEEEPPDDSEALQGLLRGSEALLGRPAGS